MSVQAQLTLTAALRDAESENEFARLRALQNLSLALLEESGLRMPSWQATNQHRLGAQAKAKLLDAAEHQADPALCGLAMLGLGQLGEPCLLDLAQAWLTDERENEASEFLRESASTAISYVGVAARQQIEADESAKLVFTQVGEIVVGLFDHPLAEMRSYAATALARCEFEQAEPSLLSRLDQEQDADVREAIVTALSLFDRPSEPTLDAMETICAQAKGPSLIRHEAAMVLAAGRRSIAARYLIEDLEHPVYLNPALEALAVLEKKDTHQAAGKLGSLVRGFFTPGLTRVRAAYALATIDPNEGYRWLRRLKWHPRASVREGVADALHELERKDAD